MSAKVPSSLVTWQFNQDDTFEEKNLTTTFVDYKTKTIIANNCNINLELWDTAGQEKYSAISSIYYKGADFVIMAYDLSNPVFLKELPQKSVRCLAQKRQKLRRS